MPRGRRQKISEERGSYHIISRTAGNDIWLNDEEKESLLKLLERFASGFFVKIHSFCIMSSHFHAQVTCLESQAKKADNEELLRRYRLLYGENAEPPQGSYNWDGSLIPDEDGGIERLRRRLGSVSSFVQELKQTFSRMYNKKHNRKGYLWAQRFNGVIVEKGEAQLICNSYIDLNPIRANIVSRPEDYRWSSLGIRVRNPVRAKKLLKPIFEPGTGSLTGSDLIGKRKDLDELSWYREFVYNAGGVRRAGKGKISQELVNDVIKCHGKLGIGDGLGYRVKNISEGLAIGTHSFISAIQEKFRRKFVRPRSFLNGSSLLFATRVLRI